jgi:hypothetical protein
MVEPTPIRKQQGPAPFYNFSVTFDEAEVQGLFSMGLSREQIFQRIMESIAEVIWEALPAPVNNVPS